MASRNEATPLNAVAGGDKLGYDTLSIPNKPDDSRASIWSVASERRYSTARVLGIMVPKDFWLIVRCATFSLSMSCTCVVANRILFGRMKFPVLFAQIMQTVGALFLSITAGFVADFMCPKRESGKSFWPRFSWSPKLALQLLPLACTFVPRILFTNGALGATQVSTYQVTRSSAIIFSVILSSVLLNYRPSLFVILSCCLIVCGLIVVGFDPTSLTLEGLVWGLCAATFSALYLVVVKYFLPYVDNDQCVLLNYNSLSSIPLLLPLIWYFGEWQKAKPFFSFTCEPGVAPLVPQWELWLTLAASIASSFLMSVASMLFVKVSSPVTYDVIGTIKGVLQTLFGFIVMGDTTTVQNITGICLSICGSFSYGKAKHAEHVNKVKTDAAEKKRLSMERRNQVRDNTFGEALTLNV